MISLNTRKWISDVLGVIYPSGYSAAASFVAAASLAGIGFPWWLILCSACSGFIINAFAYYPWVKRSINAHYILGPFQSLKNDIMLEKMQKDKKQIVLSQVEQSNKKDTNSHSVINEYRQRKNRLCYYRLLHATLSYLTNKIDDFTLRSITLDIDEQLQVNNKNAWYDTIVKLKNSETKLNKIDLSVIFQYENIPGNKIITDNNDELRNILNELIIQEKINFEITECAMLEQVLEEWSVNGEKSENTLNGALNGTKQLIVNEWWFRSALLILSYPSSLIYSFFFSMMTFIAIKSFFTSPFLMPLLVLFVLFTWLACFHFIHDFMMKLVKNFPFGWADWKKLFHRIKKYFWPKEASEKATWKHYFGFLAKIFLIPSVVILSTLILIATAGGWLEFTLEFFSLFITISFTEKIIIIMVLSLFVYSIFLLFLSERIIETQNTLTTALTWLLQRLTNFSLLKQDIYNAYIQIGPVGIFLIVVTAPFLVTLFVFNMICDAALAAKGGQEDFLFKKTSLLANRIVKYIANIKMLFRPETFPLLFGMLQSAIVDASLVFFEFGSDMLKQNCPEIDQVERIMRPMLRDKDSLWSRYFKPEPIQFTHHFSKNKHFNIDWNQVKMSVEKDTLTLNINS